MHVEYEFEGQCSDQILMKEHTLQELQDGNLTTSQKARIWGRSKSSVRRYISPC